jgi:Na+-driven multidrug efflux pump
LPVIWLIYGIGIGFEAGAASCVSRAVGRKDSSLARRLTTDTRVLATPVALLLCLAGASTNVPVFSMFGATADLLPLVSEYMKVWYWVPPLDLALWTSLASIRARGNTRRQIDSASCGSPAFIVLRARSYCCLIAFEDMGVPDHTGLIHQSKR